MASASAAGAALGFGSNNNLSLADQIANETEEERLRRLAQLKAAERPGGIGSDYGSAMGLSPAMLALKR
jgi:hypothetical protein